MKAHIVLGMAFGDEGKGITTDYLCSQLPNPIVVRFSGGQQAGHTVIIDGKKHIHSSFGAGTLRGIPSYFSEHTCIYLVTLMREHKKLLELEVTPDLTIHPLAKITTPFDVYANRQDKDNCKHGTCGLGVGKTMSRNETPYKLYAIDLLNKPVFVQKIATIAQMYDLEETEDLLKEVDLFFKACENFKFNVADYSHLTNYTNVIFEGSQGILLDMNHGIFPNVTYANTTSKNAIEIINQLAFHEVENYYVTRCYLTRHGNGWIPVNKPMIELVNNEEEINKTNKYQGDFKVMEVDYNLLKYSLKIDWIYNRPNSMVVRDNLIVTCMDQRPDMDFNHERIGRFDKIYYSYSPDSSKIGTLGNLEQERLLDEIKQDVKDIQKDVGNFKLPV